MYKFTEQTIKENAPVTDNDDIMAFLSEAVIDEDEYLRHRISERFNMVIKSLFDSHKKNKLELGYRGMLEDMKDKGKLYIDTQ